MNHRRHNTWICRCIEAQTFAQAQTACRRIVMLRSGWAELRLSKVRRDLSALAKLTLSEYVDQSLTSGFVSLMNRNVDELVGRDQCFHKDPGRYDLSVRQASAEVARGHGRCAAHTCERASLSSFASLMSDRRAPAGDAVCFPRRHKRTHQDRSVRVDAAQAQAGARRKLACPARRSPSRQRI